MTDLRFVLLLLLWTPPPVALAQSVQEEEFFSAVRRGDAAAVQGLLEAGVNVNATFRYGATALFPACDRGHEEIVRLLLVRGAEVNVRDTFYGASPLTWAASKGHAGIVRLLVENGAEDLDRGLMNAVSNGRSEVARVILARGGLKPDTLTAALAAAQRNDHTELAQILEEAGAKPPPKADFEVNADALARYAGEYRSDAGSELKFVVREGKFFGGPAGQAPLPLNALDETTFRPGELVEVKLVFHMEGGKVSGLVLHQGGSETIFKRVEETDQ